MKCLLGLSLKITATQNQKPGGANEDKHPSHLISPAFLSTQICQARGECCKLLTVSTLGTVFKTRTETSLMGSLQPALQELIEREHDLNPKISRHNEWVS